MAALLTNATSSDTANTALSGDATVLCSGNFSGSCRVLLEMVGDSLDRASVYEFIREGGVVIAGKSGHTLHATVVGGDGNESIDISVL